MVKGDGEYCTYCKRELVAYTATHPTRDHVMPRSRGGRKTVWCCTKCNNAKGDMLPAEWEWFMENFPRWWETGGAEAKGKRAVAKRRVACRTIPIEYVDQNMQRAFENAYRDREHLLTKIPTR